MIEYTQLLPTTYTTYVRTPSEEMLIYSKATERASQQTNSFVYRIQLFVDMVGLPTSYHRSFSWRVPSLPPSPRCAKG